VAAADDGNDLQRRMCAETGVDSSGIMGVRAGVGMGVMRDEDEAIEDGMKTEVWRDCPSRDTEAVGGD